MRGHEGRLSCNWRPDFNALHADVYSNAASCEPLYVANMAHAIDKFHLDTVLRYPRPKLDLETPHGYAPQLSIAPLHLLTATLCNSSVAAAVAATRF